MALAGSLLSSDNVSQHHQPGDGIWRRNTELRKHRDIQQEYGINLSVFNHSIWLAYSAAQFECTIQTLECRKDYGQPIDDDGLHGKHPERHHVHLTAVTVPARIGGGCILLCPTFSDSHLLYFQSLVPGGNCYLQVYFWGKSKYRSYIW